MKQQLNFNSLGGFNKALKTPEYSITYLKARAGLHGISLLRHSKGYIVASGFYSRDFGELDDAIKFIEKMGVKI